LKTKILMMILFLILKNDNLPLKFLRVEARLGQGVGKNKLK
jgi:hypothetical protein